MPIFGTTSSAQLKLALYSIIWEESEVQGKERDTEVTRFVLWVSSSSRLYFLFPDVQHYKSFVELPYLLVRFGRN
jgi:hypothetical protein